MAKQTDDIPRISVLDRRLQNPFGEPSGDIRFIPRYQGQIEAHWFNEDVRTGRIFQARKQLGWQPVTPDMVEDLDSIGAHDLSPDNKITRGERGKEILMWMPKDDYKQVQMAKTRINLEKMKDLRGEQKELLDAMGRELGDQTATTAEAAVKKYVSRRSWREGEEGRTDRADV